MMIETVGMVLVVAIALYQVFLRVQKARGYTFVSRKNPHTGIGYGEWLKKP